MKTGLVLEGGAMRGMFTAGVLDVFMENEVTFDGMVGVSAGAAFGCSFKSRQRGRALRYNLKYCRDKRYCSLYSLFATGDMYGADFCYYELPKKLDIFDDKAFDENPMKFYAVCTDIESGKPCYFRCDRSDDEFTEILRASASMPLVSRIVEVGGKKLLDGGISDSIPIDFFEKEGYTRNIVVLTRPADYVKKKSSVIPLMKLKYKKYPHLVKAMENRHTVYNETLKYISEKEEKGEILVIRPRCDLGVSHAEHEREKLQNAYNEGVKEARKRLSEIKAFLGITI